MTRFTSIGSKLALLLLLAAPALADGVVTSGIIPVGQIPGTTTNDNASAGNVGEVLSTTVATGSAVSLTTATGADIATVSLTAGDWDCRGVVTRNLGATTSVTILSQGISTGSTGVMPALGTTNVTQFTTAANVMVNQPQHTVGPTRLSLSATTTARLVAKDTFTVSTDAAFGQIECRRVR